jgi:tetratricopeptide (TPR) repeat protein
VEALRRTAQNQFELGHYAQAAAAYEQVARAGGNSPKVQQRLGQCYENAGNTSAAAKAFNSAVAMYQNEIRAGHNIDANKLGLAASLQALKVVGGG